MHDSINLLLDTDIGSDIDDALCLAYLLAQPRCQLMGITTVTGQARERAMLADALCRLAGRDEMPIHSGAEQPLLIPQQQPLAPQSEALSRFPHRENFSPGTAVEFLRQTIRSHPGEITLLAIGPLTNIGLLFAVDPEIPSLLKSLVLMAGVFTTDVPQAPRCEWNVKLDPHAAAIVYRAAVPHHVSIGLDVTLRVQMNADECRRRLVGGPLDMVADMAEVWFRHVDRIVFHDPLAGMAVFHPEVCRYESGSVEVELLSRQVAGMTHWTLDHDSAPHQIAVDVDAERFLTDFFDVVSLNQCT